ncbi:MAG: P-II family nitrogen regulator [Chitinivibrionales bacterium]
MKTVTAIIRPGKFPDVKEALLDIGVEMMTVINVMGCGRQEGYTESHSKSSGEVNLIQKMKIEIIVAEEQVKQVVDAIIKRSKSGAIGDGKIFVTDAPQYMSISSR